MFIHLPPKQNCTLLFPTLDSSTTGKSLNLRRLNLTLYNKYIQVRKGNGLIFNNQQTVKLIVLLFFV